MGLEIIVLSEVSHRKENIIWYHLYVESKNKLYKWSYLQNKSRLTDIENKLMVTKRNSDWGEGINIYTLLYIK